MGGLTKSPGNKFSVLASKLCITRNKKFFDYLDISDICTKYFHINKEAYELEAMTLMDAYDPEEKYEKNSSFLFHIRVKVSKFEIIESTSVFKVTSVPLPLSETSGHNYHFKRIKNVPGLEAYIDKFDRHISLEDCKHTVEYVFCGNIIFNDIFNTAHTCLNSLFTGSLSCGNSQVISGPRTASRRRILGILY